MSNACKKESMTIDLSLLKSADRQDVLHVIDAIDEQQAIDAVDPLIDHLEQETDRALRVRIALVLNKMLPKADKECITRMISSEDAFTRTNAISALKNADDRIVPVLGELASSSDRDIRKFAIDSLMNRDTPESRAVIRERLDDNDPNVVYTAVEYLGALQDTASIGRIEQLALNVDDENPMLLCTCLEALSQMEATTCNPELIAMFITMKENPLFKYSILKYLGCCGSYDDLEPYILDLTAETAKPFAKEIIDAMEGVCRRYSDLVISPKVKKLLTSLLNLVEAAEDKYELAKWLADNVEEEDEILVNARHNLKSDDPMVRLGAIEILGKHGALSDIQELERLVENVDSDELSELIEEAEEQLRNHSEKGVK